ncbi:MAG TPA: DNA gyrase inhibitor YacG [Burkholderiaceae bacterium]|nr:DNA gyrase inhibitor YacG [Burkholderiaceae bacterium]
MTGRSTSDRKLIVTCPTCGGDSVYAPDNPFRPFCCERCKNIDLGAWASESYRVEAKPDPDDLPDDDLPPAPRQQG